MMNTSNVLAKNLNQSETLNLPGLNAVNFNFNLRCDDVINHGDRQVEETY